MPVSTDPAEVPRVSRAEFDALFASVRTWGRWTPADRGAWNRVTPDHVRRAAALVRDGTAVPLGLPWNTRPGPDNAKPALHYMSDLGDVEPPEPATHKDFLGVDYHGKAVSHLDALSHIAYRGLLYGGRPAREAIGSGGARFGSVAALGPLVTRGVLLDLPAVLGVDWLEPGHAVRARDVIDAERALGVRIDEGCAVLLRSGRFRRRRELGPWDVDAASAGFHVDAMPLLAERAISLLGADGDSDVRPSPVEGLHSPVHALAIAAMGVPLLDNLDLEALAAACAHAGRHEFMIVVTPLNVPGGTGSPVSPVALL
ncbi:MULTISPECIES: cyclase family protein [unclassified Streptomyces]|uniref:cyclase family protein n=1 Tax=unclassified Streptomyces TaxID=2593676 RepID=UPI000DC7DA43|nr:MULTISPECIES: cyclase family protein [unclassified Streptomyces]AWZ08155.1 cyclase family protein [Streptomyces sp. ICC4]AWZ15942.1 cyclase family protein [Streptomyces sp. ICC1]